MKGNILKSFFGPFFLALLCKVPFVSGDEGEKNEKDEGKTLPSFSFMYKYPECPYNE